MQCLSDVMFKHKELRRHLKKLNKHNFSDIQKRVNEVSNILKTTQILSLNHPTTAHFQDERLIQEKLNFLRRIEEEYFKQRSRINWLQTGDQNTAYFQMVAKARNAYNTVHTLERLNGLVVYTAVAIGNLAANHFKGILGPLIDPLSQSYLPDISAITKVICSNVDRLALSKPPSDEEIASTLFKLNPSKSHGPDGLTSGFYKAAWSCLDEEVLVAVNSFFQDPIMPLAINSTILTLISKFPGANVIKDFRPISCCNTLYKLISKLLVARLKPLLPKLILPNQRAFIKGRLLLENCLLASEIVNGYHLNKGQKIVTLKD